MKLFANKSIKLKKGIVWKSDATVRPGIIIFSEVQSFSTLDLMDGVEGLNVSYLYDQGDIIVKLQNKNETEAYNKPIQIEKTIGMFLDQTNGFDPYLKNNNGEIIINDSFENIVNKKKAQILIMQYKDVQNTIGVSLKAPSDLVYLFNDQGWTQVQKWALNNQFTYIEDTLRPYPSELILESPQNGTTSVSLLPILSWNITDNADTYSVYITNSGEQFSDDNTYSVTTNQYSITELLDYNTEYKWKVKSINTYWNTFSQSGVFTFTTEQQIAEPNNFVITKLDSYSVTLDWTTSGLQVQKILHYSEDNFVNNSGSTSIISLPYDYTDLDQYSSHSIVLQNIDKYGISIFSETSSFTTSIIKPTLTIGAFGDTYSIVNVITSSKAVNNNILYGIDELNLTNNQALVLDESNNGIIDELDQLTTYYVAIQSIDESNRSVFSETSSFTTSITTASNLISDSQSTGVQLRWISSSMTHDDKLYYGIDEYNITEQVEDLTNPYIFTQLQIGTYYWVIQSIDESNRSVFSNTQSFTVNDDEENES